MLVPTFLPIFFNFITYLSTYYKLGLYWRPTHQRLAPLVLPCVGLSQDLERRNMSFWSKSASVRSHQHQRISRASNTSPPFPKQQVYFQTKNLNFDIVNPMVCYFFPGNDTRPTHSLLWPNNGIFFPAVFFSPHSLTSLANSGIFFFQGVFFSSLIFMILMYFI